MGFEDHHRCPTFMVAATIMLRICNNLNTCIFQREREKTVSVLGRAPSLGRCCTRRVLFLHVGIVVNSRDDPAAPLILLVLVL